MALTIGIDARAAAEVPAGRGRYVRELLRALDALPAGHRYRLYCRRAAEDPRLGERFSWVPIGLRDPAWHVAAAVRANRECDVFLSTNSYLTAWMLRVPSAVVVYDLVAFTADAVAQRRAARIERVTIAPAIRRAAALLCISEATRRDLVERYPRAAASAVVVPLAADERFARPVDERQAAEVRARHRLPGGFVLSVGTLEPRKNLPRLAAAYAGLPDRLRAGHPLVLTGPQGWDVDELVRDLRTAPDDIRLVGMVSEEDLATLYQTCTVFCYPSLYEGFGLPVLEAMASGAPVITSTVSSLPEVAGDAARLVDPRDVPALREALAALLEDGAARDELARRGRRRAERFSWRRTAEQTLAVLERMAGQRPSTRSYAAARRSAAAGRL